MGQEIETDEFSPESYLAFSQHLDSEMELLQGWFEGGKFCNDDLQIGLELEAWLIGADGRPVPDNSLFLTTLERKSVVPELSKFNFELNVSPQYLAGCGLRDMQLEFSTTWERCRSVAAKLGNRILSIGILPTVTDAMLCVDNMSPLKRYAALNKQVLKMRGGTPLNLKIQGSDYLESVHQDLMLESAATSIQVHLKVPQPQSARFYNASVVASPFTVAMAANAPLLFGRRLWDDTRITLFEQAVDTAGKTPRVSFGDRYVQHSLWELFQQNHERPVLLPAELDQPPSLMPYVRMHNGTVWNWNRPLIGFEPDGQPHLRIEHRPMSASPTIVDLFADVILYLGLTLYFARREEPVEAGLPFSQVKQNFYAAAQHSLQAKVRWIDGQERDLCSLLQELLEPAMEAVSETGIRAAEVEGAFQVLQARLESGQTGAAWQRRKFADYEGDIQRLLLEYEQNQMNGNPVHTWN